MIKSIVVMGGSFNPPTIAHCKLMKAAMEQLGADKGIYVPTSARSLRRKMRRAGYPEEVFSEETRIAMLKAMCEDDPRLDVVDVETKHPKGWYTLETMRYIQEKYPGAEVFCLVGSDKLEMFANAHRMIEFTDSFCYGVVTRDGDDPDGILRENPEAWARRDRFCRIKEPEGIDGVSSTAIREWLRTGEGDVSDMLHPKVRDMLMDVSDVNCVNYVRKGETNVKSIVVMSGSFNPPTIAHHRTMLAAVDTLDAEKGIYVPTPAKGLRYKMRKAGFPEEVLSEETRTAMLRGMAEDDLRLEVSDVECRHPKWYAMETMTHFREVYPDAELYYLIGSDNLAMFLRSKRLAEFLENFHFAVVVRDGEDTAPVLMANEIAWTQKDRFAIIPSPMEKDGVSSTAIREKFRNGEAGAEKMLHPKVMELMKEVDIWAKE